MMYNELYIIKIYIYYYLNIYKKYGIRYFYLYLYIVCSTSITTAFLKKDVFVFEKVFAFLNDASSNTQLFN